MNLVIHILSSTVVPLFVLILLGAALGLKYQINLSSLSKLYFNVFMPGFLFVNLYQAQITREMMWAFLFAALLGAANFALGTAAGHWRGLSRSKLGPFTNAVMFYNSGNMGLPLITLVFAGSPLQAAAVTAQIMVMLFQNTGVIALGSLNAARSSSPDWRVLTRRILSMPSIWILPVTILARLLPVDLTQIPLLWAPASYAKDALVATALVSLGVQLSRNLSSIKDPDVYLAVALRLAVSPMLAWLLIKLMGFSGAVAQTLLISSAAPSAVNTALVAAEFDSEAGFAGQTVLATTLLSAFTLAVVIYLAKILFPV